MMLDNQELPVSAEPPLDFPAGTHIPTALVPELWPRVGPLLSVFETMQPFRHTAQDIFMALMEATMQLHLVYDGEKFSLVLVTELIEYPRKKVCRIVYASGENVEGSTQLFHYMESWAKRKGAQEIEVIGRPGWEKMLRPLGFSKHSVCLFKELTDVEET